MATEFHEPLDSSQGSKILPDQFQLDIPRTGPEPLKLTVRVGDVLYLLGAKGAGKSGLVTRIFAKHSADARRISAHRQTWLGHGQSITADNRE